MRTDLTYQYVGIAYATPVSNEQISDGLFATTCTYTNDHGVALVVIRVTTTNVVQTLDYYPYGATRGLYQPPRMKNVNSSVNLPMTAG
jgi:hypothetical protein